MKFSTILLMATIVIATTCFGFAQEPLRSEKTSDAVPQGNIDTKTNPSDESRERDEIFMLQAYAVVFKDWQTQGKPNPRGYNVGAVLVDSRTQIPVAWGRNSIASTKNPTQHAEVRLIQSYIESQIPDSSGNVYLDHFTVYTTLEPCAMCAGMMCLTKIPRIVYGQSDDDKNGRTGYGKAVERFRRESATG